MSQRPRSPSRLALLVLAAIFTAIALRSAAAQTQPPLPPSRSQDNGIVPPEGQQGQPPQGLVPQQKGSSEPLSKQLSRSGGVIRPPTQLDPKIEAPTPDPGVRSTPIVPPPGTPGGNQEITPK